MRFLILTIIILFSQHLVLNSQCNSSYIKRLLVEGQDLRASFLLEASDELLIVGGQINNNSFLAGISHTGEVQWQHTIDITDGSDFIRYIMLDSDDNLIITARDELDTHTENVIVKYDYIQEEVVWTKSMPLPEYTRLENVIENSDNNNYLIFVMTNDGTYDQIMMELDRNTGDLVWQKRLDYGGNTDIINRGLIDQGNLYCSGTIRIGGGIDDIRPSISKFDLEGNLSWTKYYLVPQFDFSRAYHSFIKYRDDNLFAFGRGNLEGTAIEDFILTFVKTSVDGTIELAKTYQVPGGNSHSMVSVNETNDGFLVHGGYFDIDANMRHNFLMELGLNGEVLWSKKIAAGNSGLISQVLSIDDFVYFAVNDKQGTNDESVLYGRLSFEGDVVSEHCRLFRDITFVESSITPLHETEILPLSNSQTFFGLDNVSLSFSSDEISEQIVPDCECVEIISSLKSNSSEDSKKIFISNFVTPDGDGKNDALTLKGNDIKTINSVKIFSCNGTLLFESNDVRDNNDLIIWDGKTNGSIVASGTYIYQVEIGFMDSSQNIFTDVFSLVR